MFIGSISNIKFGLVASFVLTALFGIVRIFLNKMDQSTNNKKKLMIILDRANLEPLKLPNGKYEFINCDDHMAHIRRLRRDPAFCRPDIVHQCLLTLCQSPLNRAGHLQVYVHTDSNCLIKLDPQLAIPSDFREFTSIFMKLIQELKPIRAMGNSKQLAKLVRNPITAHLPVGCVKYALSSKAEDLVHPSQLVPRINSSDKMDDEDSEECIGGDFDNVAIVIGAMAHEQVTPDYVDHTFSISQYPLSAALVCAKIVSSFEDKWLGNPAQVEWSVKHHNCLTKAMLKQENLARKTNEDQNTNKSDRGESNNGHVPKKSRQEDLQNGVEKLSEKKVSKFSKDDLQMNIINSNEKSKETSDKETSNEEIWFDGVDKKLIEMNCLEKELMMANEQNLKTNFNDICGNSNGNLSDYNLLPINEKDKFGPTKEVAIDCEMVECNHNKSVLARVSIVNLFGHCIYDKYVEPPSKVTDYRTPYSGIRRQDLLNAPPFEEVQKEVSHLVQNRILVGHALHNDLAVLKFTHPKCDIRDTSRFFRSYFQGKTPSLKKLTECLLGIRIQDGEHDSIQDAQAAMRLYVSHRDKWNSAVARREQAPPGVARKPKGKGRAKKNKSKSSTKRKHLNL